MVKKKAVEKDIITDKKEKVDEALDLKLEDLEGIGTVRLKKLYANGIYTVNDLLSRGEEELLRMLDITWGDASKMIRVANESIRKDSVFSKMIVKGNEFKKYRDEKIKYLTTGLKELDEIIGGGYETGVITEYFGELGSGKTQITMLACIMAQMPRETCCLNCGCKDDLKDTDICDIQGLDPDDKKSICGGMIWRGGGLSEWGKPCRVVYIDTENSYRPERMLAMVYNRGLVKTKPQTKTEEKQDANKKPLNEEEEKKADKFLENVDYIRTFTSAMQMAVVENLSSIINGDMCPHCQKREINEKGEPTHQNHPKVKDGMELEVHNFKKDKPATLVIVDSIIAEFRKDFEGRGQLSDRQQKLKTHVKHLVRTTETKNVVCIITNQIQEALGVMGDNIRMVGGNELGHTATHIIYLKKPQSITKNKITAILVDSPNNAKNEVVFELGSKGIQQIKE
ncbi:hypothetical protein LCGC14_1201600 [marine sediment metagenome]|uniref:RecA family profile 1 domain-containing protein n=1 Tax=marine sediment metagenome TaxID=412755 RepID=A0A0F9LGP3_9ZZZZ